MNAIKQTVHFDELKFRLTEGFKKPLPGEEAQYKLAPPRRKQEVKKVLTESDYRTAGVLMLLYPVNEQGYFPVTMRPAYDGVHSAQISFPGGKKEDNDTSLLNAALRETQEEIGVNPKDVEVLGALSPLFIPPSRFMVYPFVAIVQQRPIFQLNPREVERLIEMRVADLVEDENVKQRKIKFANGFHFETPVFEINNEIIWGATAMILSEIKDMIK